MSSISFSIDLDNELYEKIEKEYDSGNYTSAIKTAILYISETIRERTELDLDGDQLVTKAFSLNDPLIRINNLETQTEKDEQIGFMFMFQGMYKAIRNPRNHNLIVDKKKECDSILIFLNYLLSIIEKAKPKFDYIDFLSRINENFFPQESKYAEELIKIIPEGKMLDVALKLCNDITNTNYMNIPYIINAIKSKLNKKEKDMFLKQCNQVLSKTTNTTLLKSYLMFMQNDWENIERLSQIRITHILLSAFEDIEFISESRVNDFGNYENIEYVNHDGELSCYLKYIPRKYSEDLPFFQIKNIIEKKLASGDNYVQFILSNFYFYLIDENNAIYAAFENILSVLLSGGSFPVYYFLVIGNREPNYTFSEELALSIDQFEKKYGRRLTS